MKYLQNRPNIRACKCPASGLIRPNRAGFGPTNGPTARSARDTNGWQVAPATVAIAAACIGAAARGTVTRGRAPQPRLAAGSRVSSMRHYPLAPSGHDRRTPSTTDDVRSAGAGEGNLAGLRPPGACGPRAARGLVAQLDGEPGVERAATSVALVGGWPENSRGDCHSSGAADGGPGRCREKGWCRPVGSDPFGMSARFIGADRDQVFLMPPSVCLRGTWCGRCSTRSASWTCRGSMPPIASTGMVGRPTSRR
jgi:hypothetical protein